MERAEINARVSTKNRHLWEEVKGFDPQIDFWILKLTVRPEECFEFNMPGLRGIRNRLKLCDIIYGRPLSQPLYQVSVDLSLTTRTFHVVRINKSLALTDSKKHFMKTYVKLFYSCRNSILTCKL